MSRFNFDEAENYGGTGGGGFFSLKNDKDVARVRFMYGSIEDVQGDAVHEVEIDGKKRYVSCLRSYNEPLSECPFCNARMLQKAKLFVPLYDVDADRVVTWERGKKFFSKIASLCARYPDIVSHVFEIERNGKAGSKETTYEIYEVSDDNTTLEDLPELPNITGGIVLEKSAQEMEYYLQHGEFPSDGEEEPVRRRNTEQVTRRTPATNRRERF